MPRSKFFLGEANFQITIQRLWWEPDHSVGLTLLEHQKEHAIFGYDVSDLGAGKTCSSMNKHWCSNDRTWRLFFHLITQLPLPIWKLNYVGVLQLDELPGNWALRGLIWSKTMHNIGTLCDKCVQGELFSIRNPKNYSKVESVSARLPEYRWEVFQPDCLNIERTIKNLRNDYVSSTLYNKINLKEQRSLSSIDAKSNLRSLKYYHLQTINKNAWTPALRINFYQWTSCKRFMTSFQMKPLRTLKTVHRAEKRVNINQKALH